MKAAMEAATFIGVDVGSASVRAGVFDAQGHKLAFAVRPIKQFNPRADVFEQSSADIWRMVGEAVREAVAASGRPAAAVRGIGFDATCSLVAVGEAPVSVAEDGDPQRDIIMWMDHRAVAEAAGNQRHRRSGAGLCRRRSQRRDGNSEILWLRRRFPDRHRATRRYFDLADYLVWRACGEDVASVCTLTCKWNYLAHENRFSETLLAAVGLTDLLGKIPAGVLPLGSPAGPLGAQSAAELGLPPGIAVATGIIDAHAGGLALCAGTRGRPRGDQRHLLLPPGGQPRAGDGARRVGTLFRRHAAGLVAERRRPERRRIADRLDPAPARRLAGTAGGGAARRRRGPCRGQRLGGRVRAREAEPTARLHVLADHHGNRSPRADPLARGAMVGLTLEAGRTRWRGAICATRRRWPTAPATSSKPERRGASHQRVLMTGGGAKNALSLREHADATGCDLHLVGEEDGGDSGQRDARGDRSGAFPDLRAAARAMARPAGRFTPIPRAAPSMTRNTVSISRLRRRRRYQRMMDDPATDRR